MRGDLERTNFSRLLDAAELVIVDQLFDLVGSAGGAAWILAQLEGAEVHAQSVDEKQATDEWVADAEDELDDLGGLNDSDEARQDAEDAAFGAGWDQAGGWGFGVEAAVAVAFLGGEYRGLALKAEDGTVCVGLACEDAGVVDEVARLEVVGAVGDDVVVLEDLEGVGRGEHRVVLHDVGVLVQALDHLLGGVDLEHSHGVLGVDDLALQIRFVDDVEVYEAEGAYPGGGEVEGEGGAEAAGADAEDPSGLELL